MRDQVVPQLVKNLHPVDQRAVLLLTKRLIASLGDEIESIKLFSSGRPGERGGEDVELLVLTRNALPQVDDIILDAIADVTVDTGVCLMARTFSLPEFNEFQARDYPIRQQISRTAVPIFQA